MMHTVVWAVFLALGTAATCEDYYRRRVDNRLILLGLAASLACYACWLLNTCLGSRGIVWHGIGEYYLPASFYRMAAVNAALGVASALALWYLRIWPAGDAKLFILCAVLLPLIDPNLRGFPDHLVLLMLIDIFVASAAFVLVLIACEWLMLLPRLLSFEGRSEVKSFADRARTRAMDELPKAHRYAMFAWNTFALFFVYRLASGLLNMNRGGVWGTLAIYGALYLVWGSIRNVFVRWDVAGVSFFAVSCILACWGFWYKGAGAMTQLMGGGRMAVGFWIFLPTASVVVDYYLKSTRTAVLELGALSSGMILSDESWKNMSEHAAFAGTHLESGRQYVDGLSHDELALIQDGLREDTGRRFVVYSPKPFAGWVFFGCLWALLSRRNVLEYFMRLF